MRGFTVFVIRELHWDFPVTCGFRCAVGGELKTRRIATTKGFSWPFHIGANLVPESDLQKKSGFHLTDDLGSGATGYVRSSWTKLNSYFRQKTCSNL